MKTLTKAMKIVICAIAFALAVTLCAVFTACGDETEPAATAESVALSKSEAVLTVGESVTLTATVTPSDTDMVVEWTTSDDEVASVDGGKVTAVGGGEATITAKAGGKSATCTVTVGDTVAGDVTELETAVANAKAGDTIVVEAGEYVLEKSLIINKSIAVIGAGDVTITREDAWNTTGQAGGDAMLIGINETDGVTLKNLTVTGAKKFNSANGSGINVYKSTNVLLENVKATSNAAAGIIVNSSSVTLKGVVTKSNAWGGVNVDDKNGAASVSVDENCAFGEMNQIYCDDSGTFGAVTVTAAGYSKVTLDVSGSGTVYFWTADKTNFPESGDYTLTMQDGKPVISKKA